MYYIKLNVLHKCVLTQSVLYMPFVEIKLFSKANLTRALLLYDEDNLSTSFFKLYFYL